MIDPTRREALAATVGGAVGLALAAGGTAGAAQEGGTPKRQAGDQGGPFRLQQVNLDHIRENSFDTNTLRFFDNSVSIGPVEIRYQLDLSVPQITFSVYLLNVRIGGGSINPTSPNVTVGGSVDGFKAEVKLAADFSGKKVTYDITASTPLGGVHYAGTLFSWS